MNSKITTFKLSLFDEFIAFYKSANKLALEALEEFDKSLLVLDSFLNLYKELTESVINSEDVFVKWYKSATISSSDTIRVTSEWYNQPIFDHISVNMCSDEIGKYITKKQFSEEPEIVALGSIVGTVVLVPITISRGDTYPLLPQEVL